ncbi:MAG: hypothetical protein QGI45_04475 [Myxococcota bacterium]|nr:hypothetical protein [Myxococcota bacterium]
MKKFVILAGLALFAAGCSDGEEAAPKNKDTQTATCDATSNNLEACLGTIRQKCQQAADGSYAWSDLEDCATGGQVCSPLGGVTACTSDTGGGGNTGTGNGEELSTCGTDGDCDEGLHCSDYLAGPLNYLDISVPGYCVRACSVDADCNAGELCVADSSTGACLSAEKNKDEICYYDGTTCVAGTECQLGTIAAAAECKETCGGENVGTASGCNSGTCLAGNDIELQDPTGQTTCTADADCDSSANYQCYDFASVGAGKLCARMAGWCGDAATVFYNLDDLNPSAGTEASNYTDSELCEFIGQSRYCADLDLGDDGAIAACVPSGYAASASETMQSCTSDADCLIYLGEECLAFQSGNMCAIQMKICVAFCEGESGDLACPTGKTCGVPDSQQLGLVGEYGTDDQLVTCTTAADCNQTDGASDFGCEQVGLSDGSSGNYCVRAPKVCMDS